MSYNITGTTITLTRGDTFEALVSATKRDGAQYIPVAGDTIRFAMKENYDDPRPLLPEGSEMATDDDIDSLIDDIFGTGVNPDPDEPTYSPDDIATEKELNDAITDVFG